MSENLVRIGLVTEGPIDADVLRGIASKLHTPVEFVTLQPEATLGSGYPNGWRGVKAWCREEGQRLAVLMSGIPERPIHLLIVHTDCSMADKVDARRACPPAKDTADALREVMRADWLQLASLPSYVVLATPSLSTDAWLLGAIDPQFANCVRLECDHGVEAELSRRKVIRLRDKGRKRRGKNFGNALAALVNTLDAVCLLCTEAGRLRSELGAALPTP